MKALVISPYDGSVVLEAASTLARVCTEALKKENFEVDTLEGLEAKRKNLPKNKSYDLILFCGHGEERSLLGSDGRAIFDDANIDYCEGAVVIAIACKSGKWLSMSATSKGAIAYFSFRDICYLPQSSEKHAYMSDFIRTFSVPLLALLEGYTLHLSLEEFQRLCLEYATKYEEKEYDEYSGIMSSWMRFNSNAAKYEGRPNATLGEEALVVKWSP
ncbi:unnamed protein product [marine sediment metagenome]|uniref:CHAT domain-containing protein n=1 Tax=marine sediment metagenome TaxID=412755 RepID=X1FWD9_9ZZZZ